MNRQIVTALCVVWMGVCIVSALVRGHTHSTHCIILSVVLLHSLGSLLVK